MSFAEADFEDILLAHERLRAEHLALTEIFEQSANDPPDLAAQRAQLGRLREHRARLQSHRALLRAM